MNLLINIYIEEYDIEQERKFFSKKRNIYEDIFSKNIS